VRLSARITIVPVLHGTSAVAKQVRSRCLQERFDCIAVDIPGLFQDHIGRAALELPLIQAVVAREEGEGCCYYLPIDPCDAAIEGVRQSQQNHVPYFCIGASPQKTAPMPALPDEHAIATIGFDRFAALCLRATGNPAAGSDDDRDGAYLATRLHELSATYRHILALVHFRRFARTVRRFFAGSPAETLPAAAMPYRVTTYYINPDHLYFALGELPFIAGKFEQERLDPFAKPIDSTEEIKNLFRETRDDYYDDRDAITALSPARIQAALTFSRNLTVMENRLLPSLFDLVEAARGVGGNGYALRVLKNARYYPFLPFERGEPLLDVGIDRIRLPESGEALGATNLLRDRAIEWRQVSIRPDPSLERKKRYRYAWNPGGMCSHVPEDRAIERFNAHVRVRAREILVEEFAHHEKFTTSVKDGIDIRETLRNWHTGSIYVRETPPAKGRFDTVVLIFDEDHDENFPNRSTWYAEHGEESTLTFYATDPFANLIGPGIAECRYGGLSLLFPPRPVPDIFELTEGMDLPNYAARVVYGALLFSAERVVAYVGVKKPSALLRTLAARLKKRLLWIPLASFSNETVRNLRRFHILNGKEVRSWAARFIGEG
jgi:hypothetical protein